MREILFRGKRTDNGEWAAGSLWLYGENAKIFDCLGFPDGADWYKVDPATVGQYTGLKDKSGKRIFEGDILHVVSYTCDYELQTSVGEKYGYTSGLYVDGDFDVGYFNEIGLAVDWWANEDAEVEAVGNIHDNPEMMEDTK